MIRNTSTNDKKLTLGDISVNFANILFRSMRQLKTDPQPLIERFNLPDTFLNTPGARISIPKFMRLGYAAIQATRTPHFGLIMGSNTTVSDIGLGGFASMSAPTLGEALQTLIRFESLNSQNSRGHSRFKLEEQRLVCQFYSISPYNQYNYFVVDCMLSSWYQIMSWMNNSPKQLHHIEVEYGNTRYQKEYEQRFGCPVYFNAPRNALILNRGVAARPSLYANTPNYLALCALCNQAMAERNRGKNIADRVVELISSELNGQSPNIDLIAEKMGMAAWTLRRKLANEKQSFNHLLDQTRKALALTYVRDTQHNFTEIAFLLGFSSPAAFQRAFKRWTQSSPGQFRNMDSGQTVESKGR